MCIYMHRRWSDLQHKRFKTQLDARKAILECYIIGMSYYVQCFSASVSSDSDILCTRSIAIYPGSIIDSAAPVLILFFLCLTPLIVI